MNSIIKYGSVNGDPLYDCGNHTPEEWSLLHGTPRPILGAVDVLYGIIISMLYLPMVIVMLKEENFKLSCFKIMTLLGIVDIFTICINSIITGVLMIEGAVFCTYPNFIYIAGMCAMGLWGCSCMTALILVLNRILDLSSKRWSFFFFASHRIYFVLSFPIFYGLYFVFTTATLFNSTYGTWFFDPFIFPNKTDEYSSLAHGFNNIFIVAITCFFYVFFYCSFRKKIKSIEHGHSKSQMMSANIFFQAALICIGNQIAAIVYVVENFMTVPLWLIFIGHVCWQFGHGIPVIIYLSMNQTIRNDVLVLLGLKIYFKSRTEPLRPSNSSKLCVINS